MSRPQLAGSIFSQKLDRVAFIAYALGAIVPLIGLAVVVQRFVVPGLDDRLANLGLIGAVVSIAVLSLASFLVLRTVTRRSLERMDSDNRVLAALLDAAGSLGTVQDGNEAGQTVAAGALAVSGASAVFVFGRGEPGRPQLLGAAGEGTEKPLEADDETLGELVNLTLSEGHPALRGPEAGGPVGAALPIPGEPLATGALVAVRPPGAAAFAPEALESLATLAGLASIALHNVDLRDSQRNFFTHVTDILVSALDGHLGYNTGHSQRVAQLANRVGRAMNLDEHQRQRLHFGALLHDIGLLKFDRATKKNSQACQKHTQIGARMLQRIRLWQEIAPIVLHHHEWVDGAGYPDGIAGDAIPLESRIIAVCDAFDAMTSPQSYKVAVSVEAALREVERMSGSQFDPGVVEAFQELAAHGALEIDTLEGH